MAITGSRSQYGPDPDASGTTGSRRRTPRLAAAGVVVAAALTVPSSEPVPRGWATVGDNRTTTPIKHLVVLFQENVPFDRYFGVYPHALNPPGEPRFDPAPGTPMVNGLTRGAADGEPERGRPAPPRPDPAQRLRVQPRLHRRAAGRGSGPHGPLRPGDRQPRLPAATRRSAWATSTATP